MITPSYGLTATERVLPSFVLDWTTGLAQDAVDVTRAGVATYVDADGFIQVAAENTQRVDYTTGVSGILIEESRTNLLLQSENFSVSWSSSASSVSLESITNPYGTTGAYMLTEDGTTGTHYLLQTFSAITGVYSASVFAKAGTRTAITLLVLGGTSPRAVNFSLVGAGSTYAETIGGVTPPDLGSSIKAYPNGWYRCTISWTAAAQTSIRMYTDSGAGNGSTDGNGTVYLWGAQLEAGAFPTSYIPTEASAVTRNADVATVTGTNFSDFYNAAEGTFVWHGNINPTTDVGISFFLFSANDGTTGNQIRAARRDTTTADRVVRAQIDVGGVQGEGLIASGNGVFTGGVTHKLALAYKLNSMGLGFDGVLIGTDSAVTIPTVNRLNLGTDHSAVGATFLNGRIQKLMYYPQRLINAELTAFSK